MHRTICCGTAGALAATLLLSLAAPAAAGRPWPAPPAFGDPYFPLAGNGGCDVARFAPTLDYVATTGNRLERRRG